MARQSKVQVLDLKQSIAQAMALQRAGQFGQAARIYKAILKKLPDQFESLHFFGVLRAQQGKFAEAAKLFAAAVEAEPGAFEAHNNLGNAYQKLGQSEKAIACHARAIELEPRFAEAHYNLGLALARLGRFEAAAEAYRAALEIRPESPQALTNLGSALRATGRLEEGIAQFREAVRLAPGHAQAHNNLGNALRAAGRHGEAVAAFERAAALAPDEAEIHANLGVARAAQGNPEGALAAFERALAIDVGLKRAYLGLGQAYRALGLHEEAIDRLGEADARGLLEAEGMSLLTRLKREVCDWSGLAALEAQVTANVRSGVPGTHPFIFLAISESPADQLACAGQFAELKLPRPAEALAGAVPYGHERLKIAYLSADFHDHPTSQLAIELFEAHDRARFETVAVSFGPDDQSPLRRRLENAFDRFIDVRGRASRAVAEEIRALEIDITVDMSAYTDNARLDILSHRPAPLQAEYLVFPGTLGTPFIDYLLVDETVAPASEAAHYAEALVQLPDCYQASAAKRQTGKAPARAALGLPDEAFVFCAFNAPYKITPRFFALWTSLLAAVPESVLWLLGGHGAVEANLRGEAAAAGIDPARLVIAPRVPLSDHLARLACADLFLDCLPYGGHTTVNEALWAGLPVLTQSGTAFPGRVAASLLRVLGLDELIAQGDADYCARALQLARRPDRLQALKARLAAARATTPLFDAARFARHLEASYEEMQRRLERGEPPAGFAVEPIE